MTKKQTLARRHMTQKENKNHVSPWLSEWWNTRKKQRAKAVEKREANAKEASRLRNLKGVKNNHD